MREWEQVDGRLGRHAYAFNDRSPRRNARHGTYTLGLLDDREQQEVLYILRGHFARKRFLTPRHVRDVVRFVVNGNDDRRLPHDFPSPSWIKNFLRLNGFARVDNRLSDLTGPHTNDSMPSEREDRRQASDSSTSPDGSVHGHETTVRRDALQTGNPAGSMMSRGHKGPWQPVDDSTSRSGSSNEGDETDANRGGYHADIASRYLVPHGYLPPYSYGTSNKEAPLEKTASGSERQTEAQSVSTRSESPVADDKEEKRSYRQSRTVPPETWERAIAAVEQQGMSLRAAARMHGVHFAALHRRVRKRAQRDDTVKVKTYFHPDDEAGIIRVVVARAEIGVLMTFAELIDLVQRAAMRNLPDISVQAAANLLIRFQTKNERSLKHIVEDWPASRTPEPFVPNGDTLTGVSKGSASGSPSTHDSPAPLVPGNGTPEGRIQPHVSDRTYPTALSFFASRVPTTLPNTRL